MRHSLSPRLLMILSMTVFGTLGPFVRYIPLASAELAMWRAIAAALLIGLVLLLRRTRIPAGTLRSALPLLLLSGAAMGVNWILLFEAYRYTTVSAATLSYYFAPVLVTLLCPLLFRERMTARNLLCFIMSTLGIVLITGFAPAEDGNRHLIGILFGLGAAVLYASVILLNKAIRGIDGITRTFFQFLAAALVLIPYTCLSGPVEAATLDLRGLICLAVVCLVHTGLNYCLYFSAIRGLPGQQTAILSYIDPLVAVIVSVTVLGEAMTVWQVIGGVLILGFTLFGELSAARAPTQEKKP